MNRQAKVLQHLNTKGKGLEIGPSHNPIAPKKAGYDVDIIDHMSREELIEKYREHNLNLDNIEEVDFVWQGESYAELTGKEKYYDWIIASHLIEHTPDLIGFLNDCDKILKDDGVISLVIPDKRYCFDHYRPLTGLAQIIDSYFQRHKIHTPGTVAEYYLNVVRKGEIIAWDANITGEYSFVHSLQDSLQGIKTVREDKAYIDVHAWCFVPHSFRLLIHDLHALGFIPFQEVGFAPTAGCEFYITLSRQGMGSERSRLEMLKTIEAEINAAEPQSEPEPLPATVPATPITTKSLIKRLVRRLKVAVKN